MPTPEPWLICLTMHKGGVSVEGLPEGLRLSTWSLPIAVPTELSNKRAELTLRANQPQAAWPLVQHLSAGGSLVLREMQDGTSQWRQCTGAARRYTVARRDTGDTYLGIELVIGAIEVSKGVVIDPFTVVEASR